MKNLASYHVQQAIEKMLKYCIYNKQTGNTVQELCTHNLDTIIRTHCASLGIHVPKKIVRNAKEYTRWEAESRYALKYNSRNGNRTHMQTDYLSCQLSVVMRAEI
ncbi:HEPN domain-containing protein [Butyrivibrio sp. YAB3001]|uniref:HEPN domain-containing protein n=1 Tax=Butyrivibrio sp. YAB3001 TaxID=1520812 RepID=UPI00158813BF|nr:HEPN domain-containing protein [Butyrivibrio sp. YAB3001]